MKIKESNKIKNSIANHWRTICSTY